MDDTPELLSEYLRFLFDQSELSGGKKKKKYNTGGGKNNGEMGNILEAL